MPNPDVFFGILQGYGEASHAQAEKEYQEEQDRRKTIAQYFLNESKNPNRLPESQHQMATNFLRIVQTPGHKKLDKDLQNIGVEDIAKVSTPWQGGQTQRQIPLAPSPIPSELSGPGGALPIPPQPGAPLGIQTPSVAPPEPPKMHAAAPASIGAPVPPPPAGYKPTRSAFYSPEEQIQMKSQMEEQTEAGKITGQWSAKIAAADKLVAKGIPREEAEQILGIRQPKPPTPPPRPRALSHVAGTINDPQLSKGKGKDFAAWDPDQGRFYDIKSGTDISDKFEPSEGKASSTDLDYEDYLQHPDLTGKYGADRTGFNKYKADQLEQRQVNVISARENIQYPVAPEDRVRYIADQITQDADLAPMLIGSDKRLRRQVDDELSRRGTSIDKLAPQTRQMAQTARDIVPQFDKAIAAISDPKIQAKLGPILGRWNDFEAGKVGRGDPDFARLRVVVDLLKTGALRAHFGARGGQGVLERFDSLADIGKMDAPTLKAALEGFRDFLRETYVIPRYGAAAPQAPPAGGRPPLSSFEGR